MESALGGALIDLVVSDMAPNMSGIRSVDQARAARLAELALEFAINWLKPGGNMLVKTFQGTDFQGLRESMRLHFGQVLTRKPEASRSRSNEIYLLAKGLVPQARCGEGAAGVHP